MPVRRLVVTDFRNITNTDIEPATALNFISGDNGSGKTSLLESLSTLALGRSFRTRKYKNIIRYHQPQLTIFCEFDVGDIVHKTGISRFATGESIFKLDDRKLTSSLELINMMPLQVINANSFNLLSGAPSERRQFLDWLVFHVKHSFQSDWRNYMRCLKQRNALLRSDRIDISSLDSWNKELAQLGEKIDSARGHSIQEFLNILKVYSTDLEFIEDGDFSIEYQKGWKSEYNSLYEALDASFIRDKKLGYTTVGAHKSDIKINYNRKPVTELFSRGQLKSLVAALYMSQIELFIRLNPSTCLLLIDDLPAELDELNLIRVSKWISKLKNVQVFITGVDLTQLINLWPKKYVEQSKLFHVKQGRVTEQSMYTE